MSDCKTTGFAYLRVEKAIEIVKVRGGVVTLRVMGQELNARKGDTIDLAPFTLDIRAADD